MKQSEDQKAFFKDNKEVMIRLFNNRVEELKEFMIAEMPEERDRIIEAIKENKRWLEHVERLTSNKKPIIDTGI